MSDEPALLAAIIAHAEEDTPRLVYADWLEENGHPERAEFIRAQCRYARACAAQSDYSELFDRCFSSFVRAAWWLSAHPLELPAGFVRVPGEHPDYGIYRRGLCYRARGEWYGTGAPDDEVLERLCANLEKLVTTTTVRALDLGDVTPAQLARVLAAPGAEALTGLWIGPNWTGGDQIARVLARARSVRGLTELALNIDMTGRGVRALAGAKFDRLESFSLPDPDCSAQAMAELTAARWFRRLKSVEVTNPRPSAQPALLAALPRLRRLERLVLDLASSDGLDPLASANAFPELGALTLMRSHSSGAAEAIARGPFPKLRALTVGGIHNSSFRTVLRAPWCPQLQVLDVSNGRLNDRSVQALAKAPVAANLRALVLGNNPIGPAGLRALGDGEAFPNLVRLDLDGHQPTEVSAADVRRFLTKLNLPRLVDLYLDGWPLHTAGAQALAANPAAANLVGLSLARCGLTDRGFAALVRSPHLQRLELFKAMDNRITNPSALLKRNILPALRDLWLTGNRIVSRTGKRLKPSRNWVMEFSNE
jgi:uncharacterized protein (TIGR02996 family)